MGQVAAIPSSDYGSVFTKGTQAIAKLMTFAFHHSEAVSRKMVFMSAFELELEEATKKGKDGRPKFDNTIFRDANGEVVEDRLKGVTDAEKHAREIAEKKTYEILFKYDEYNRPAFMKNAPGKVAFQFYTFPMMMTSFLARNAFTTLKGASKVERREAMYKLVGTLGMTGMFSGVVGLPMYSVIMGTLEAIRDAWGDDDDDARDDPANPYGKVNIDLFFRTQFLPSFFGPDSGIAALMGYDREVGQFLTRGLTHGPVSTIFDANIGTSTSLNNLYIRTQISKESKQAAVKEAFYNVTGAAGSMIAQLFSALDEFEDGNILRGIEKVSPAFFRGGFKSMRLTQEGLETRQGVQVIDPEFYHVGKLFAQGLGLGSTTAASMQEVRYKAKQIVIELGNERTDLLKKFNKAIREEDDSGFKSALENIHEFNFTKGIGPIHIGSKSMRKSVKGTMESRQLGDLLQGLVVPKSQMNLVQGLLESTRRD